MLNGICRFPIAVTHLFNIYDMGWERHSDFKTDMHASKLILQSRAHGVNVGKILVLRTCLKAGKKWPEQCIPGNEANALSNLVISSNNKEGKRNEENHKDSRRKGTFI